MKVMWLGHSAFRIETGEAVVLIDPFLTGNSTFEASGMSVAEASAGCTHVALTHGHDDHVGDTVEICKQTGATLIAVFEIAMYLNAKGVEKVDPTNTGGTVHHDGFSLTFVNALHSSGTIIDGQPIYLGNPCGLILHGQDKRLYHMGDTDIFGDMALIQALYQPQIGLVPIGDRFTMGAATAAHVCKTYFKFESIVPIHYGTFPIIDPTADAFVAEMVGENVIVATVGEMMEL